MAVAQRWHETRIKEETNLLRMLWRIVLPLLALEAAAVRIGYLWIVHSHAFLPK